MRFMPDGGTLRREKSQKINLYPQYRSSQLLVASRQCHVAENAPVIHERLSLLSILCSVYIKPRLV